MNHFRVIFKGLTEQAEHQGLTSYFHKELGLTEERIRALFTSPPRVLWHASNRDDAVQIQEVLQKMGCTTYVEPLVTHPACPFAISQVHYQIVKRELSKVRRVQTNLVLLLVQVDSYDSEGIIPSFMGDVQKQLTDAFRESDTVIGIDDSRSIVLGFSTDTKGVTHVQDKVRKALTKIVGNRTHTSMGYALFPHEARSLQGLLHLAENRRSQYSGLNSVQDFSSHEQQAVTGAGAIPEQEGSEPAGPSILKARGKAFKTLMDTDPETLWVGIHRFSREQQKAFSARLPFDSHQASVLEGRIDEGHEPASDPAAERHLEAVLHQIELGADRGEDRKARRKDILENLNTAEALPTLPSVAAHIFKIASAGNSSAQDITKVIVNDPPLTSKLLKIVNSAFYGFPQKISTVKQAVVILGTEEIIDLSFALAAAKAFDVKPVEGLGDPKHLWKHAISTGFIAQDLCKKLPKYQNLGAFTAGLLHDFGKIFLIDKYPDAYAKICLDSAKNDLALFEAEEEWLGLSHAYVGETMATSWNLPEALSAAIAFHHEPSRASIHQEFVAIIGLADYLYYQTEQINTAGKDTTGATPLTLGHWRILQKIFHNLNTRELVDMTERANRLVEDSHTLFSLLEGA